MPKTRHDMHALKLFLNSMPMMLSQDFSGIVLKFVPLCICPCHIDQLVHPNKLIVGGVEPASCGTDHLSCTCCAIECVGPFNNHDFPEECWSDDGCCLRCTRVCVQCEGRFCLTSCIYTCDRCEMQICTNCRIPCGNDDDDDLHASLCEDCTVQRKCLKCALTFCRTHTCECVVDHPPKKSKRAKKNERLLMRFIT